MPVSDLVRGCTSMGVTCRKVRKEKLLGSPSVLAE